MMFELKSELKTLCCNFPIAAGEKISTGRRTSKNRVFVIHEQVGSRPIHRVKLSSLKMAIKEEEIPVLLGQLYNEIF